MDRQQINAAMEAKLKEAGIPFESVKVFGVIRQNVHIKCKSRDTAQKWALLLAGVFKGAKVSCTETMWEAAVNKGTSMRPTMHEGWLIGVAA